MNKELEDIFLEVTYWIIIERSLQINRKEN